MKKLYRKLFYIPKNGKISEKAMLVRVIITVLMMVGCLAAMSISAYAFFSYNVSSEDNVIKSASFEMNASIDGTEAVGNGKSFSAALEAGREYSVTLSPDGTAATGFCSFHADGSDTIYHTQQLGVDTNAPGGYTASFTFKITVTNPTTVIFDAHWGTSSYYGSTGEYYVASDDLVEIDVPAGTSNHGDAAPVAQFSASEPQSEPADAEQAPESTEAVSSAQPVPTEKTALADTEQTETEPPAPDAPTGEAAEAPGEQLPEPSEEENGGVDEGQG